MRRRALISGAREEPPTTISPAQPEWTRRPSAAGMDLAPECLLPSPLRGASRPPPAAGSHRSPEPKEPVIPALARLLHVRVHVRGLQSGDGLHVVLIRDLGLEEHCRRRARLGGGGGSLHRRLREFALLGGLTRAGPGQAGYDEQA